MALFYFTADTEQVTPLIKIVIILLWKSFCSWIPWQTTTAQYIRLPHAFYIWPVRVKIMTIFRQNSDQISTNFRPSFRQSLDQHSTKKYNTIFDNFLSKIVSFLSNFCPIFVYFWPLFSYFSPNICPIFLNYLSNFCQILVMEIFL